MALEAVDTVHEANSCTEIDSELGAVCGMNEHAENGLFVFCGFTVSPLRVSLICFSFSAVEQSRLQPLTEDSLFYIPTSFYITLDL